MNKLRKPISDFTAVPNALICDTRISLKAKGTYCLLFSKPDGWVYIEEVLVKESTDGRDAFRSGVQELIAQGWLVKQQVHDEGGKFSHTDWLLTADGKSGDGLAVDGKSATNNTDKINTDVKKKERAHEINRTSIAVQLEPMEQIPSELRDAASKRSVINIDDEWAKFRNHHISARSKHTRVDLCWDTWCRNSANWQGGSGKAAGGRAGQGGIKRHDHMAAATDTALADLFGVRRQRHDGATAEPAAPPCPWGDGDEAAQAGVVDAVTIDATCQQVAGGAGGGGEDSDAGAAVPHPLK